LLQNTVVVKYSSPLFFAGRGEHSKTQGWLWAEDDRCWVSKLAEEWSKYSKPHYITVTFSTIPALLVTIV